MAAACAGPNVFRRMVFAHVTAWLKMCLERRKAKAQPQQGSQALEVGVDPAEPLHDWKGASNPSKIQRVSNPTPGVPAPALQGHGSVAGPRNSIRVPSHHSQHGRAVTGTVRRAPSMEDTPDRIRRDSAWHTPIDWHMPAGPEDGWRLKSITATVEPSRVPISHARDPQRLTPTGESASGSQNSQRTAARPEDELLPSVVSARQTHFPLRKESLAYTSNIPCEEYTTAEGDEKELGSHYGRLALRREPRVVIEYDPTAREYRARPRDSFDTLDTIAEIENDFRRIEALEELEREGKRRVIFNRRKEEEMAKKARGEPWDHEFLLPTPPASPVRRPPTSSAAAERKKAAEGQERAAAEQERAAEEQGEITLGYIPTPEFYGPRKKTYVARSPRQSYQLEETPSIGNLSTSATFGSQASMHENSTALKRMIMLQPRNGIPTDAFPDSPSFLPYGSHMEYSAANRAHDARATSVATEHAEPADRTKATGKKPAYTLGPTADTTQKKRVSCDHESFLRENSKLSEKDSRHSRKSSLSSGVNSKRPEIISKNSHEDPERSGKNSEKSSASIQQHNLLSQQQQKGYTSGGVNVGKTLNTTEGYPACSSAEQEILRPDVYQTSVSQPKTSVTDTHPTVLATGRRHSYAAGEKELKTDGRRLNSSGGDRQEGQQAETTITLPKSLSHRRSIPLKLEVEALRTYANQHMPNVAPVATPSSHKMAALPPSRENAALPARYGNASPPRGPGSDASSSLTAGSDEEAPWVPSDTPTDYSPACHTSTAVRLFLEEMRPVRTSASVRSLPPNCGNVRLRTQLEAGSDHRHQTALQPRRDRFARSRSAPGLLEISQRKFRFGTLPDKRRIYPVIVEDQVRSFALAIAAAKVNARCAIEEYKRIMWVIEQRRERVLENIGEFEQMLVEFSDRTDVLCQACLDIVDELDVFVYHNVSNIHEWFKTGRYGLEAYFDELCELNTQLSEIRDRVETEQFMILHELMHFGVELPFESDRTNQIIAQHDVNQHRLRRRLAEQKAWECKQKSKRELEHGSDSAASEIGFDEEEDGDDGYVQHSPSGEDYMAETSGRNN